MPRPMQILLVDDDPMVRSIFQEFLTSIDHQVIEAGDGRQAMEIFDDIGHDIDLVITDICMPVMNGIALLRHVRKSRANIPVAVITAYAHHDAMEDAKQLGARIYRKPLDFSELTRFLDSLPAQ